MKSKLTQGSTTKIFEEKVLNKFLVSFYQCNETGYVQTEEPYWLNESYSSIITKLDVGLVNRNIEMSQQTEKLINKFFNPNGIFIDYAGGYGLFTRLMRDKGFNFYHTDKYCSNIFAEYFDLAIFSNIPRFDVLTAFEVFEHMVNPIEDINVLFKLSDNILFSTELLPTEITEATYDWWYFSFETGQHISFYTLNSLHYLSNYFDCNFYSNGINLHLFTKKKFEKNPFNFIRPCFLERKIKKIFAGKNRSLINQDWIQIKNILNKI